MAVGTVDLDAVESCTVYRVRRGTGIERRVFLDLREGERAGRLVLAFDRDGGGSDVVETLARDRLWVCDAPHGPELHEYEAAVAVDGVGHLLTTSQARYVGRRRRGMTSFQADTWSSLHMPATCSLPPACGAMTVASVMRRPPGMDDAR